MIDNQDGVFYDGVAVLLHPEDIFIVALTETAERRFLRGFLHVLFTEDSDVLYVNPQQHEERRVIRT